MAGDSRRFGEVLRSGRTRAELTQRELADLAGVSLRTVRNIEHGRVRRPHQGSVRRLAAAVGLNMAAPLRIGLLGPLEVLGHGGPVAVRSMKQRCLLGLLALRANQLVSRDEIVDVLWGDHPPESCVNLVHTYVGRIRKAFEPAGGRARMISGVRGGYLLTAHGDQLDSLRFEELVSRAKRVGSPAALEAYAAALDLWRGPVLADLIGSLRHHPAAVALSGHRLTAALAYADLAIEHNEHDAVVRRLQALAHEEQLHEGLHARWMLTLAGSGQRAAALRLFTEVRDRLVNELGVQPGAELQDAHLRILRADGSSGPQAPAEQQAPAQLPADITGFTGRSDVVRWLDGLLPAGPDDPATAVVISSIEGSAGVGKTALAVHWAHRVQDRFPGGQLYVNLRGHAPGAPVRPLDALTRFLHALGMSPDRVPVDLDEAAGVYRTLLAKRKMLVVLDNAASVDQVRPLLPGSAGSLVLVTSRGRLAGLTVREGAHRLSLDVLSPEEARALLVRSIGPDRVSREPEAAAELAEQCARLPLALRIAAANLTARPHTGIGDYNRELRAHGRLAELSIDGDEQGAVGAAFDLSYTQLQPAARRLFRLLGLAPGTDVGAGAAMALVAGRPAETRQLLGELSAANLVQEHARGRYQFHDLLREYAAARAGQEDTAEDRAAAVGRLLDFYLHTTSAAARLLYPDVPRLPLPAPAPGSRPWQPAVDVDAARWLDTERHNLLAVAIRCAEHGPSRYAWQIADALRGYFTLRGHGVDGLAMCYAAVDAAVRAGDEPAEAAAQDILGLIHYNRSGYRQAIAHHDQALTLYRRAGNRAGEASTLHNLGRAHSQLDHPAQEVRFYIEALTINRAIGNRFGEAQGLNYLGVADRNVGRPDRALPRHIKALELSRKLDNRDLETRVLQCIGITQWALGQLEQSVESLHRTLITARQLGFRHLEAGTYVALAESNCDAGDFQEAEAQARTALRMAREVGERRHESGGLEILGNVARRTGRSKEAIGLYTDALDVAREIGYGYGAACVRIGLCATYRCLGRPTDALQEGRRALTAMRNSGILLMHGPAMTEVAYAYLKLNELDQARVNVERAVQATTEGGLRLFEARARHVLGLVHRANGAVDDAVKQWRTAVRIFTEIGTAEAGELETLIRSTTLRAP